MNKALFAAQRENDMKLDGKTYALHDPHGVVQVVDPHGVDRIEQHKVTPDELVGQVTRTLANGEGVHAWSIDAAVGQASVKVVRMYSFRETGLVDDNVSNVFISEWTFDVYEETMEVIKRAKKAIYDHFGKAHKNSKLKLDRNSRTGIPGMKKESL